MLNFKTSLLTFVVITLMVSSGFTQKESVILYNSQPVKVELSEEGKINSFIGMVPGYMKGFKLVPSYTPQPVKTDEIVEAPSEELVTNAGYAIVSNEKVELTYKPNFATLDKALINKLDDIAARLKANPQMRIYLTAHAANTSSLLTKNRLESAIAYLGIKGVGEERIQKEILKTDELHNTLVINYLY